MVKEEEAKESEDKKKKEAIEVRNQAESLVYQTQKSLDEMKDKIDSSEAEKIQKAINELQETLKNENASKEEIEAKVKTLTEASHKLAEAIYQKDQNAQGNTAQSNNKKDDDVIDAEVE